MQNTELPDPQLTKDYAALYVAAGLRQDTADYAAVAYIAAIVASGKAPVMPGKGMGRLDFTAPSKP